MSGSSSSSSRPLRARITTTRMRLESIATSQPAASTVMVAWLSNSAKPNVMPLGGRVWEATLIVNDSEST